MKLQRQCSAHAKQTGRRCRQPAIPGGTVCRYHGGAAPQVQRSAQARLAALVDPAIERLAQLLTSDKDAAAYRAVKDVLDRAGLKPKEQVTVTGQDGAPLAIEVTFVSAATRDDRISGKTPLPV